MDQGAIVVNDKGERLQLVGDQWRPLPSVAEVERQQRATELAKGTSSLGAAGMGIMNSLGAGYWSSMPNYQENIRALQQEHPWAFGAGSIAPVLPAALAGGMSIPAQAAIGAVSGALADAENPVQSGLVGGLLGAGVTALPGAAAAAYRGIRSAAPQLGEGLSTLGSSLPGTMGERVTSRMMAARGRAGGGTVDVTAATAGTADDARYLKGALTVDEAKQAGIPLTMGDELALQAQNAQQSALVRTVRNAEELRRSDPLMGAQIEGVRVQQRQYMTQRVLQEIGEPAGTAITPQVMGSAYMRLGATFDDYAQQLGRVNVDAQTLSKIKEVAEQAGSDYAPVLQKIVSDVERFSAQNQGAITGADWQLIRTRLGNSIDAGTRQGNYGKLQDALAIQELLQEAIEASLPQAAQAEIVTARHQYRVLKQISQAGVVSPDGEINALAFRNSFGRNPGRYKSAVTDDLKRTADTIANLQTKITPDSGTAARLLANPVRAVVNPISASALAAGAAAGAWMRE